MPSPDREIPQRELRNQVARVLSEVQAGTHLRVTVGGRPVADLVPIPQARNFVPRVEVEDLLERASLDADFAADVGRLTRGTVDEL